MIFVTVGSQKFQFNRLLQYIDHLVEHHIIWDEVFAQTGASDYQPQNYRYKDYLDREKYNEMIVESQIIITHAGTGTIMRAVKAGKKVIAVPRLSRYKEHVDDHQEQIIKQLIAQEIIVGVRQLEDLEEAIMRCRNFPLKEYKSNTHNMIESIENYIRTIYPQ